MVIEHAQRGECKTAFDSLWNTVNRHAADITHKVPYWMFCAVLGAGLSFVTWMTLSHFSQQSAVVSNAATVQALQDSQKVQDATIAEHNARLAVAVTAIAVQDEKFREIVTSLADIKAALGLKAGKDTHAMMGPPAPDTGT